MSFTEYAVTAPAGERDVVLVKIDHETWGTPLRYADDVVDWDVIDEESDSVTFPAAGIEVEGEPTDETGIDSRSITIADPNLVLWRRLEKLSRTGNPTPVQVTVYRYLSSDLTTPASFAVLPMSRPSRTDRLVSFEASNANTINRDAPWRRFTYSGNPGLRR